MLKPPNPLALAFVLVAFGVRVLFAPVHLLQEEHLGAGGHPVSHAASEHGHDPHEHGDHEHDEDHLPHSALDHVNDLIAQRAQDQQGLADLLAVPLEDGWSFQALEHSATIASPDPRPPKRSPRSVPRPRGPPAAA